MSKLIDAMGQVNELHKKYGIDQGRGGKKYTQVVHRMEAFRTVFGLELGVDTKILVDDGQRVVVKAIITDRENLVVGAGMAEEIRGQGPVNKTSALENCETSAIGRALASIGLAGGEYASINEIDAVSRKSNAMEQNRAAAPSAVPNAPDVKVEDSSPSPEQPPEPPKEEDEFTRVDKELYLNAANELRNCKTVGLVHNLFAEYKDRIKEVKSRNEARADHLIALFKDRESELKNG